MSTLEFNVGEEVIWRGIKAKVEAWQDTPTGRLYYCSMTIQSQLFAYWLNANDLTSTHEGRAEG